MTFLYLFAHLDREEMGVLISAWIPVAISNFQRWTSTSYQKRRVDWHPFFYKGDRFKALPDWVDAVSHLLQQFKASSLIFPKSNLRFCILACHHSKPGKGMRESPCGWFIGACGCPVRPSRTFSCPLCLESGAASFHPISWGEFAGARLSSWGGGAQAPSWL